MSGRVTLLAYEKEIERTCAAAMRSCYSPYAGFQLFEHRTGAPQQLPPEEKVFDDERVRSMIRKSLELGHLDILEHGGINWLVEGDEKEVFGLLNHSRFFDVSQLDAKRWLLTTNLRVLVELAWLYGKVPLFTELADSVKDVAPTIWEYLKEKAE